MKKVYRFFAAAIGSALCCVAARGNQLLPAKKNREGATVKGELLVSTNRPNSQTHTFFDFAFISCSRLASKLTFGQTNQTFLTAASYMTIAMPYTFNKVTLEACLGDGTATTPAFARMIKTSL